MIKRLDASYVMDIADKVRKGEDVSRELMGAALAYADSHEWEFWTPRGRASYCKLNNVYHGFEKQEVR